MFSLRKHRGVRNCEWEQIAELPEAEKDIIVFARPFTMTGVERMASLINAVNHVCKWKIPGDFVECGVWRGGSMMVMAKSLMMHGDTSRDLFLYDTYEGMTEPTEEDKTAQGVLAKDILDRSLKGSGIWCEASLEDVRQNVYSTGYPKEKIHFIKGPVEQTIPATLPKRTAILRLDTDWYESTKHELIHLFPLLDKRGILIIDDYGAWKGARKAVDEYFEGKELFLHRIDTTGRMAIGIGPM